MKVATINVHTPYLYSLSRIKHKLYCLINLPEGQPWRHWDDIMRPKPENIIEVDYSDFKAEDYDVLILQAIEHLRCYLIKLDLPKIYIQHCPFDFPWVELHELNDPNVTMVFVSELVKQKWRLSQGVRGVVIETGIPNEFYEWSGEESEARVLTVQHNFAARHFVTGFNLWRTITRGLPTKVLGVGNQDLGKPAKDFDELRHEYSGNRVYLHTGISDCMAMREALMTGMPVVITLEKIPFENEVELFKTSNLRKMREYLELCLNHPNEVKEIAEAGKKKAVQRYDINKFTRRWEKLLRQTTGTSIQTR